MPLHTRASRSRHLHETHSKSHTLNFLNTIEMRAPRVHIMLLWAYSWRVVLLVLLLDVVIWLAVLQVNNLRASHSSALYLAKQHYLNTVELNQSLRAELSILKQPDFLLDKADSLGFYPPSYEDYVFLP